MVAKKSAGFIPIAAYLRTSTYDQENGIDAQLEIIRRLADAKGWRIVKTYIEHESGGDPDRPELDKATRHCRRTKSILVVAKLDRLARDAQFLMKLYDSDCMIAFGDFPDIDGSAASRFMVQVLAAAAEFYKRRLSENTREGMAAAKARGRKFGTPANLTAEARIKGSRAAAVKRVTKAVKDQSDIAEIATAMRANGATLQEIADHLTGEQFPTRRGSSSWSPMQVKRILDRGRGCHEKQSAYHIEI